MSATSPSPSPVDALARQLAELEAEGLLRRRRLLESAQGTRVVVDGEALLSFASNDYLGLSSHPDLARAACGAMERYGVGAGASHLLTGHHVLHQRAEEALAAFAGLPAALLFSSGYLANLGVVTALLGRHGAVFADRLNHASLVDAVRLSGADHVRYPHLDLAMLERRLRESPARDKLIVSDIVFSMDGDLAPLPELLALAEKYEAWLYLDDAHGFGVLGAQGRGGLAHFGLSAPSGRLIYMATLGKAAGVSGAFVAGHPTLVEWLVNRARTYIYTTATPPAQAAAVLASLERIAADTWRRDRLASLVQRLRRGAAALPWTFMPSTTPIQPLRVGDSVQATRLAEGLRQRGILVPAIRPPTVPRGQSRLRISLSAAHDEADVDRLLATLAELAGEG